MTIRYELGYHEKWEAWMHENRAIHERRNTPLSVKDESVQLEIWMTKNLKTAFQETLCTICSESIAQHLIEGKPPFKAPESAKQALVEFNLKFGHNAKARTIKNEIENNKRVNCTTGSACIFRNTWGLFLLCKIYSENNSKHIGTAV
jgi:hypothetical protein